MKLLVTWVEVVESKPLVTWAEAVGLVLKLSVTLGIWVEAVGIFGDLIKAASDFGDLG